MRNKKPFRDEAGFTLMEAIIALAILALSATALLGATEVYLARTGGLESRAIAQWVAENRLVELRLAGTVSDSGSAASTSMLGHDWQVEVAVKATTDADLAAVDILVREEGASQPLLTFGGFVDVGRSLP